MILFKDEQHVQQLERRRGGYFYLVIPRSIVLDFEEGKKTRLICKIDELLTFQCGLNHLGNGDFFIIVNAANLKKLGRKLHDRVAFEITKDPNPLGVEMPEVMTVLFDQDPSLKLQFEKLSMSKRRNIIYNALKIKDVDLQVREVINLLSR